MFEPGSAGATTAGGCLPTALVFALMALPVYLVLAAISRMARAYYGFDPAGHGDDGPALRICGQCHNTVLEPDFAHCPYCGAALPDGD